MIASAAIIAVNYEPAEAGCRNHCYSRQIRRVNLDRRKNTCYSIPQTYNSVENPNPKKDKSIMWFHLPMEFETVEYPENNGIEQPPVIIPPLRLFINKIYIARLY